MSRIGRFVLVALVSANVLLLSAWSLGMKSTTAAVGDCGSGSGHCTCKCGGSTGEEWGCWEVAEPVEWTCTTDNGCESCPSCCIPTAADVGADDHVLVQEVNPAVLFVNGSTVNPTNRP